MNRITEYVSTVAIIVFMLAVGSVKAQVTIGGVEYTRSTIGEAVTVDFRLINGGKTIGQFSDLVELSVSGYGWSQNEAYNDAFYLFTTDYPQTPIEPVHDPLWYQLAVDTKPLVGTSVEWAKKRIVYDLDANIEVVPPYVPQYRSGPNDTHTYNFVIDLGDIVPSLLYFGVVDGNFTDNGQMYSITVYQLEPGTVIDADEDGIPDSQDNCPANFNPEQGDTDGDGTGDVCDDDDDNDGVEDWNDNCPLDANTFQEDDDYDGLGNACDTSYDAGSVVQHVEYLSSGAVDNITIANPPGGNGMISKLTGNGGVIQKLANAVVAFDAGAIDIDTYLSELQAALDKLNAFDNQLNAKIGNGSIVDPEATDLLYYSEDTRAAIVNLIEIATGS